MLLELIVLFPSTATGQQTTASTRRKNHYCARQAWYYRVEHQDQTGDQNSTVDIDTPATQQATEDSSKAY